MLYDKIVIQEAVFEILELIVFFSISKINEFYFHFDCRIVHTGLEKILSLLPHSCSCNCYSYFASVRVLLTNLAVITVETIDMYDWIVVYVLTVYKSLARIVAQVQRRSVFVFTDWHNPSRYPIVALCIGNAGHVLSVSDLYSSVHARIVKKKQLIVIAYQVHFVLCAQAFFWIKHCIDGVLSVVSKSGLLICNIRISSESVIAVYAVIQNSVKSSLQSY